MVSDAVNSSSSSKIVPLCNSLRAAHEFTAWSLVCLLLSPILLSTLYLLYRKWRSAHALSHSDVFTTHLGVMELLHLLGTCLSVSGFYSMVFGLSALLGMLLSFMARTGRFCFHDLTSVERYLAVVHPIVYLRLKKGSGVWVRNIGVGFSWLLSSGIASLVIVKNPNSKLYFQILILVLALSSSVLTLFCAIAVLSVLVHPRPGEGSRDWKSINQSKRVALYTMGFILAAQMLNIVNSIVFYLIGMLPLIGVDQCLLLVRSLWLEVPNTLVLPLLFLYRARRNI